MWRQAIADRINCSREEMVDHSERQMIYHLFTQLPSHSPARSMRRQSTRCAPTPKGRDEMHLAVGTDGFHKP